MKSMQFFRMLKDEELVNVFITDPSCVVYLSIVTHDIPPHIFHNPPPSGRNDTVFVENIKSRRFPARVWHKRSPYATRKE